MNHEIVKEYDIKKHLSNNQTHYLKGRITLNDTTELQINVVNHILIDNKYDLLNINVIDSNIIRNLDQNEKYYVSKYTSSQGGITKPISFGTTSDLENLPILIYETDIQINNDDDSTNNGWIWQNIDNKPDDIDISQNFYVKKIDHDDNLYSINWELNIIEEEDYNPIRPFSQFDNGLDCKGEDYDPDFVENFQSARRSKCGGNWEIINPDCEFVKDNNCCSQAGTRFTYNSYTSDSNNCVECKSNFLFNRCKYFNQSSGIPGCSRDFFDDPNGDLIFQLILQVIKFITI